MVEAPVGFICSACSASEISGDYGDDIKAKNYRSTFKDRFIGFRIKQRNSLLVVPLLIALYVFFYLLETAQVFSVADLGIVSKNLYYLLPGNSLYKATRFISSGFVHANFMHLLSNSISLLIIGPFIERQYGAKKFMMIYTSGLLAGSIITFLLTTNVNSVGASGAIVSLFGFYAIVMYRITGSKFSIFFFLGFMMFQEMFQSNVNIYAHLAGFFVGLLYGLFPKLYKHGWMFNLILILFIVFVSYVRV